MEKVVKAIAEHLDVDASKVVPEASLIDDLGADDFDIVELTIAIQEATGTSIRVKKQLTLKQLATLLK